MTWVKGKHQFSFGGEWVQNQLNIGNVYQGNGNFGFDGRYSAMAERRIGGRRPEPGLPDGNVKRVSAEQAATERATRADSQPVLSGYFHANKQLTLVGGLRWGPNVMPHDYFNRGVEFNMANFLSNTVSTIYPNAPAGDPVLRGQGVTKQFTKNSYLQFSPNVGASFDPVGDGKTVFRSAAR